MATDLRIKATALGMLTLAYCIGFSAPFARAEDVQQFKSAPSVEDLERALGTGGPVKKYKTRSIVLDPAGTQSPAPVPSAVPAAQPYATPQYAPQYAPQPVAVPAPQPEARSNAAGKAVGFPIKFASNSANVREDALPFLQAIAGVMQKDPNLCLVIEGHTDAKGNYLHNVDLSRARAAAVMNTLISHFGIDPSRLQSVGKGPNEPLNISTPMDPANRRVQFRVTG